MVQYSRSVLLPLIVLFIALSSVDAFRGGFASLLYRKVTALTSTDITVTPTATASDAVSPRILCIIPSNESPSYFRRKPSGESVPWREVLEKISSKIGWESFNDKYDAANGEQLALEVQTIDEIDDSSAAKQQVDVLFLMSLNTPPTSAVQQLVQSAACVSAYNCSASMQLLQKFGEYEPPAEAKLRGAADESSTWLAAQWELLSEKLLSSPLREQHRAYDISVEMWRRRSVEDLVFLIFVLVDTFTTFKVKSVKAVTTSDETSPQQLISMCSNCANEMKDCLTNPTCRQALDCLNSCKGNDQVCSYRCITSYETPEFEKFAFCILQKNNCMGNTATMPSYPDPQPLAMFRGQPLDFETAEDIFIGHLQLRPGETNPLMDLDYKPGMADTSSNKNILPALPWSWKVVCGQNPAYDYFACQHQLFYPDKKRRRSLWYDPVFKVRTLSDVEVWRRRHYRVRRGSAPGQFYFSVLDNGVRSNEFWRIVDCADDLSWAVFYYSGAAAAAGTSYIGALLVTPDGNWPDMSLGDNARRIEEALLRGEITMWELYEVDNSCCDPNDPVNPPPLGLENP